MHQLLLIVLLTWVAGFAIFCGAALAKIDQVHPGWLDSEFRHSVTAFGGGALLSAIALVLIPEGSAHLSIVSTLIFFGVGALCFMWLDIWLNKINTPASQLAAMLSDFIPESIALGAAFATDNSAAYLLAVLISLQNFPEGFNAFREMTQVRGKKSNWLLCIFFLLSLLGPLAGIVGFLWLSDTPSVVGAIMVFASGGILYSVFQDIAPQVKLARHWGPPMGAILGFGLGLLGHLWMGK